MTSIWVELIRNGSSIGHSELLEFAFQHELETFASDGKVASERLHDWRRNWIFA